MTKAEIASAVNEWFNIENYSVLQNLTVEQLFQEIENRIVAYRMGQNSGELPPESRRRHQNYYEELIEGKVVFGDVFGGQKKTVFQLCHQACHTSGAMGGGGLCGCFR